MGIFHALSGKKKCIPYDLLVCYQHYDVPVVSGHGGLSRSGMPALSPSAADVSITMGNTPLDKSLMEQIRETEGVDKVFGRMEMGRSFCFL